MIFPLLQAPLKKFKRSANVCDLAPRSFPSGLHPSSNFLAVLFQTVIGDRFFRVSSEA